MINLLILLAYFIICAIGYYKLFNNPIKNDDELMHRYVQRRFIKQGYYNMYEDGKYKHPIPKSY